MRLLVCDMDGVLFEGQNFWLDLHHRLGTEKFALELWEKYGRSDYRLLSELTAQRWEGREAETYFKMCRARKIMPGADRLFAYCAKQSMQTAIISSGPWHLARRAQKRWGIDRIFANKLGFCSEESAFDGTVDVQVDDTSKDTVLAQLQAELGISPEETIVIGDSHADARMTNLSNCSIGYNVDQDMLPEAFHFYARDHLANVMPHVEGCSIRADALAAS